MLIRHSTVDSTIKLTAVPSCSTWNMLSGVNTNVVFLLVKVSLKVICFM